MTPAPQTVSCRTQAHHRNNFIQDRLSPALNLGTPPFQLSLSESFLQAHGLDPNFSPDSITADQWDYIKMIRGRDAFTMDRGTYADPTLARVLSTVEYTPESRPFNHPRPRRRHPFMNTRYASMPVEDLVFCLDCADGPLILSRRAVLLLYTAQVLGRINVTECRTADVAAVVAADAAEGGR